MEISEEKLIESCKKQNIKAQGHLYDKYSSKFLGVCLRYTSNKQEAEDLLHDAFIKIFTKIHQYGGQGSFEGWMRRIVANTAIQFLRDSAKEIATNSLDDNHLNILDEEELEIPALKPGVLMNILQKLPNGYKLVFNMYVFEKMQHQEIADKLGISLGTSKSQLNRARAFLRNEINKLHENGVPQTAKQYHYE